MTRRLPGRRAVSALPVAFVLFAFALLATACRNQEPEPPLRADPAMEAAARAAPAPDCRLHVELHDGAFWARKLGRPQDWVQANHKVFLWKRPGPDRGDKIGELHPGARAIVLRDGDADYRVQNSADGAEGWLEKVQVAHTLHLNVRTHEACEP